jgi:caffeoyl-CoA O-methyltransferase
MMQQENHDILRRQIDEELTRRYASEDDALHNALKNASNEGLPNIQISALQGKLLQVLAVACRARKILEIGALGGYSGTWLARALPTDGKLITLELSEKHAAVVRATFAAAGVGDRTEVRVGPALTTLPNLEDEAPFDLIFIDADKENYPAYLDWAIRYSRPGTVIVADNIIRMGRPFQPIPADATEADHAYLNGLQIYNERLTTDPRLVAVAIPMDDDGLDGFGIAVVRD